MTPNKRRYKREYAGELLRIAKGDLGSARDLRRGTEGRRENICYLIQQSVEKCLKAILCHLGEPLSHTHDIEALISLIPAPSRPPMARQLVLFTEYATVRRYEEGYEILSAEDLDQAIQVGQSLLEWTEGQIGGRGGSHPSPPSKRRR